MDKKDNSEKIILDISKEIPRNKSDLLTAVEELKLDGLGYTEIINLHLLPNLKYIDLDKNLISKMAGFTGISKLIRLDLENNKIQKIEGLEELTELEILDLKGNIIKEITGLANQKKLTTLSIEENEIQEIKGLNNCQELEMLNLSCNTIVKMEGLEKLNSLKLLNLYNNKIQEINGLSDKRQLIELILSSNNLTEIKGLEDLENLEYLNISNNNISEIKGLEKLINLKEINLENNPVYTIENLKYILDLEKIFYFDYKRFPTDELTTEYKKKLGSHVGTYITKEYQDYKEHYSLIEELYQTFPDLESIKIKLRKKIVPYYDSLIDFVNKVMNIYGESWERDEEFPFLIKLLDRRIELENKDSKLYYILNAKKNVFLASTEDLLHEQIILLEKAIEFFDYAEEDQCSFFYKVNLSLTYCLKYINEQNFEECNLEYDSLIKFMKKRDQYKIKPEYRKMLEDLTYNQKKILKYKQGSSYLSRKVKEVTKFCDTLLSEILPKLKISEPAINRLFTQTTKNMKDLIENHEDKEKIELILNEFEHQDKRVTGLDNRLSKVEEDLRKLKNIFNPFFDSLLEIKSNEKMEKELKIETIYGKIDEFSELTKFVDVNLIKDKLTKNIKCWKFLNPLSKEYLITSEIIYDLFIIINRSIDTAPIVLEFCRVIENELFDNIFNKFKKYLHTKDDTEVKSIITSGRNHEITAKFAKSLMAKTNKINFGLGSLVMILKFYNKTHLGLKNKLMKNLIDYYNKNCDIELLRNSRIFTDLYKIVKIRNSSAHPGKIIDLEKIKPIKQLILNTLTLCTKLFLAAKN